MPETLEDIISSRRLRWLGHLARITDERIPKNILFLAGCQIDVQQMDQYCVGDKVKLDMKRFHIDEKNWLKIARDRFLCSNACTIKPFNNVTFNAGQSAEQQRAFYVCNACARSFRRPQDIACHKCNAIQYSREMSH